MKKSKYSKVAAVLIILVSTVIQLVGCQNSNIIDVSKVQSTTVENKAFSKSTSSNFNDTGYPIVKDKINIKAVIVTGNGWSYNDSPFMKMMENKTNIRFDFEQIPTGNMEKLKLKFASRNFPDVMFRTDLPLTTLYDAALAGDIIPLDALIEKYSPNWSSLFKEQPDIKTAISAPDGHIYSLPNVSQNSIAMGIRDQWFINEAWLKELNISIPVTLEEYVQALRAFRDNKGKGSIPSNAIPWYFHWDEFTSGPLDVYGAFGVFVPDNSYMIVKDGKVLSQLTNPDIKKPLAFFQQAYEEKLFPPEVFIDTDWASYINKVNSYPAILGSYHGFNKHLDEKYYERMAPPKVPGVERAYYREQFNGYLRLNQFTIFKGCSNPEALMRWADLMGDPEISIQVAYGLLEHGILKKIDNRYKVGYGKINASMAPGVDMISLFTRNVFSRIEYSSDSLEYQRKLGVEFYAPYMAPVSMYLPLVKYTDEENSRLQKLNTDIYNYTKTTFIKWITESINIETQWNEYTSKLKSMKIDELLKIKQAAYDRYIINK